MKLLKRTLLLGVFILLFTTAFSKVNAASASLSTDKTTMKVGETATIKVSYTAAAWNIQVSGAVTYSDADASSNAKNTTINKSLSFKPSKAGTFSVSLTGDVTDGSTGKTSDVSKTIKITVNGKTTNNNNNDNGAANNSKLSNDATLSNLGIKPNDFSGFRKANTTYNVSVPKSTEKISIYATPSDSKATVSGTGSKTLKIGKNTFDVKVTAEDKKTTKTYTLNIARKSEDEISTDATLSNLGIRPKEYDFTGFKSNTTDYKVFVPNEVEKINIYAYPTNQKATVSGNGEKTLELGENTFEIKVTAEDKKTAKTYKLSITRDEEEELEDSDKTEKDPESKITNSNVSGITNIRVENYELSPEFSSDVYKYNVDITDDVTSVDVDVETSESDIETEVVGNENLQKGNNVITILVHDTKNDETKTYQIIAYLGNKQLDLQTFNNEINEVQKELKIKFWIIRATIVLIIVLIFVFLVQRYRLQNEEFEDEEYSEDDEDKTSDYDDFDEPRKKAKYKGKRFK